jgi:putative FmdB family regulatory protein
MPIFEYICQECQHEFEALVFGRDKAKCPKCQSKKLSPQLSVFAMSAKAGGHGGSQRGLRLLRRSSRPGRLLARRPRLAASRSP